MRSNIAKAYDTIHEANTSTAVANSVEVLIKSIFTEDAPNPPLKATTRLSRGNRAILAKDAGEETNPLFKAIIALPNSKIAEIFIANSHYPDAFSKFVPKLSELVNKDDSAIGMNNTISALSDRMSVKTSGFIAPIFQASRDKYQDLFAIERANAPREQTSRRGSSADLDDLLDLPLLSEDSLKLGNSSTSTSAPKPSTSFSTKIKPQRYGSKSMKTTHILLGGGKEDKQYNNVFKDILASIKEAETKTDGVMLLL